ncbi:hypothetical protein [Microvirga mediterraneensis]|nr:hypothetical protein [Microvirga mediterraneensis]
MNLCSPRCKAYCEKAFTIFLIATIPALVGFIVFAACQAMKTP